MTKEEKKQSNAIVNKYMKDIPYPEQYKPTISKNFVGKIIRLDEWTEKNKKDFIKKNNPKLYKKLYE